MQSISENHILVPKAFYKYKQLSTEEDFDRLEEILLGNMIYFTSPGRFNDPFDCRPAFDFAGTKQQIKSDYNQLIRKYDGNLNRRERRADTRAMMRDPSRNPRSAEVQCTIQDEYYEELNKIGVLCVSEVDDDILMWAHYGGSHSGVCLVFDGLGKMMASAQPIHYDSIRPRIPQFNRLDSEQMMKMGLLTKANHWRYEKEWRLIRYKEGHGLAAFRPENITGIILGARISKSTTNRVMEMLARRPMNIKVYQAKISRTSFTLDILPSR